MKLQKTALVLGAGGFIGNHLVRRLKRDGFWVKAVDLRRPEYGNSMADIFLIADLRNKNVCQEAFELGGNRVFDETYQLAADMGGAAYIFSGEHDAVIMCNSVSININVLSAALEKGVGKIFFSSSACIYPAHNQEDQDRPNCAEDSAYPAAPDSEYGWEKLFSERLYLAFSRNYGINVRIGRLHNIFGPESTWTGGREKVPAALCRKICSAPPGGEVEIWGDGQQTRSFLYIDECLDGIRRLMDSTCSIPINIGSQEMISIDSLARMIMKIAGKDLSIRHVSGCLGVRGRNSDNRLIQEHLGWAPSEDLAIGIEKLFRWVKKMHKVTSPNPLSYSPQAASAVLNKVRDLT